jgi:hypothetical protein
MKNTMTRKTSAKTGACNSNHNETMVSGLRVRTAVKAGMVVTKVTDCSSTN